MLAAVAATAAVTATATASSDGPSDEFGWRAAPTGTPIKVGMVNTEGAPGLDFPEMRTVADLSVAYLNEHGGWGGRPIVLEHCAAAGSPESSQACAEELVGKGVETVILGLDLFPGYATYAAAGVPVIGALPILPGDYSAQAQFVSGGNLTVMAGLVAVAQRNFQAKTAAIISADNPGANNSEAALKAALDKAKIGYVSIKGGDNETDAGFEGLMREATKDDPDVLFSLYADAGCIGAIRARVALGLTIPTLSTAICGSKEVLDVVGDDAVGWNFLAVGSPSETPAAKEAEAILERGGGDLKLPSLGLGALSMTLVMTLGRVANAVAAGGAEVTGASIRDRLATATDLRTFPGGSPLACGSVAAYPSVCSFEFPVGEYVAGGTVRTIPGFEAVSVIDYLP